LTIFRLQNLDFSAGKEKAFDHLNTLFRFLKNAFIKGQIATFCALLNTPLINGNKAIINTVYAIKKYALCSTKQATSM
jgi:hypothetical protein